MVNRFGFNRGRARVKRIHIKTSCEISVSAFDFYLPVPSCGPSIKSQSKVSVGPWGMVEGGQFNSNIDSCTVDALFTCMANWPTVPSAAGFLQNRVWFKWFSFDEISFDEVLLASIEAWVGINWTPGKYSNGTSSPVSVCEPDKSDCLGRVTIQVHANCKAYGN